MRISLGYGDGRIAFDVPDECVGQVVRPPRLDKGEPARLSLAKAVERASAEADAGFAGKDVLVLLADGTRDQPNRAGLSALAQVLRAARSIRVLISTGTHRADTPDNCHILKMVEDVCSRERLPLVDAGAHDCRSSPSVDLDRTSFDVSVVLNRWIESADVICIVSEMKPHYFAGYSNPAKFLLPGLARYETVEQDHALTLQPGAAACRHPLHPDPSRRDNPVARNQLEAARIVADKRPVFALASVGDDGNTRWARFGPLEQVVAEGIRQVDAALTVAVDRPYRRAVISCGGYPHDETLYTAQRSLELTKECVADGAEVLWLAECRNGVAASERTAENFFAPLKGDAASYARTVRAKYVMFGHKAVLFHEMLLRLTGLYVTTALPSSTLDGTGLIACSNATGLVSRWAREGEPILFVDGANKLAITTALK